MIGVLKIYQKGNLLARKKKDGSGGFTTAFNSAEISGPQTAIQKAVLSLRSDSMARSPGTAIGQEPELLARYGVGRSTLRQAARLVANEQLLEVRAGTHGGYYAARPTFTAVAHMAAIFLHVQNVRMEQIIGAVEPVRGELMKLAAKNADAATRQQLEALLKADQKMRCKTYTPDVHLAAETTFNDIVGQLSGNPLLFLFLQIAIDLLARIRGQEDSIVRSSARRMRQYAALRDQMIRAIIANDPKKAVRASHRSNQILSKWLKHQ
jgi:GntR family transcriptional repressor for pyruvate dehydrogenase complex